MAASQGRRRSMAKPNTEDHALNQIASEAEARLAAKRTARAEARSIRMKELERMQHEADEKMDREYQRSLLTDDAVKQRTARVADKFQARIAAAVSEGEVNGPVSQEIQIKSLQENLREMSERFKKAMVSNAQLDNEKQALSYQVDCLKDRLEDSEERIENLKQEITDKSRECNRLSRENKNNIEELGKMREQLILRDKLLEEHGIPTDGSEQPDISQLDLSTCRINESLHLDSIELEQSVLNKSRGSSRRSSIPDDRESLLEQIKMLKEKVSDLRREPELDDVRLRDVENLQTSGEDNERPGAPINPDLERSEPFEDITDEAIEIHDRLRSGMFVNNNERTEDYDVIEQNLQQGEVASFEDKSYENSILTESMTDSMLGSFTSTVVTTDSVESERPLEISMSNALEDEAAARDDMLDSDVQMNAHGEVQKHSEKDLHEYDIVESTNEQRVDKPRERMLIEDLEGGNERELRRHDIVPCQQAAIVVPGSLRNENVQSMPADTINITSVESESPDVLVQKSVMPDLDSSATGEGACSDRVDVGMPAAMAKSEDPTDPEINDIATDICNSRTDQSMSVDSTEVDGGSSADLPDEGNKRFAGEDAQDNKPLNNLDYLEGDMHLGTIDINSMVDIESNLELNADPSSTAGIIDIDSMIDSEPNPRSNLGPSNIKDTESLKTVDDSPMRINENTSLDAENADERDDEDAFFNIESEEAFYDARSDLSFDDSTNLELQENLEVPLGKMNARQDSKESAEIFEEIEMREAEGVADISVNDLDADTVSVDEVCRDEDLSSDNRIELDSGNSNAGVANEITGSEVAVVNAETDCVSEAGDISAKDHAQIESNFSQRGSASSDEFFAANTAGETITAEEIMLTGKEVKRENLENEDCDGSEIEVTKNVDGALQDIDGVTETSLLTVEDAAENEFANVISKSGEIINSGRRENEGIVSEDNLQNQEHLVRYDEAAKEPVKGEHPVVMLQPGDGTTLDEAFQQGYEDADGSMQGKEADEGKGHLPKDKLIEAYNTRRMVSSTSPGISRKVIPDLSGKESPLMSIRDASTEESIVKPESDAPAEESPYKSTPDASKEESSVPVPKQRKKNKKKKKKTKEVVKVLQRETSLAMSGVADELRALPVDKMVEEETSLPAGGITDEMQASPDDVTVSVEIQDADKTGSETSLPYAECEGVEIPPPDYTPNAAEEASTESEKPEGFKDAGYLEVRRPSGSSISDFSDSETGARQSKKDKKKSKKDSKKESKKDGDLNKQSTELKVRIQKLETENARLEGNTLRLETQAKRYKSQAEAAESVEDTLLADKRRLARELRNAQEHIMELETEKDHLQKRVEKYKQRRKEEF